MNNLEGSVYSPTAPVRGECKWTTVDNETYIASCDMQWIKDIESKNVIPPICPVCGKKVQK